MKRGKQVQQIKLWLKGISIITGAVVLLFSAGLGYAAPVPAISATDQDSLQVDVNGNGQVNKGDTIRHTITIQSTGSDASGMNFSETIDPNTTLVPGSLRTTPVAANHSYAAIGNVRIQVPAGSGLLLNSFGIPSPTAVAASGTSTNGGNYSVNSDGSFTYNPSAGFEGTDTFDYTVTNPNGTQTGTVNITVSGMIWFVNNNTGACSSNCDGRLTNPFTTLSALNSINDGVGLHPADGDNIFLYESGTAYEGPLTLRNSQKLIGQGATATLQTITGLTTPVHSDSFPSTGGTRPSITTTVAASNGVNLANGNTLRGFDFGNATGIALSGSNFGTLTLSEVAMNTNSAGLSLTTGAAAAAFSSFASTGGTNNVSLTSVTGTVVFGGGSMTGATGAAFAVSGGTVSATYSGSISQANNAAMVSVSGGHITGTLAFDTGTLNATNGTGLQFDNADGTYNFNGTTTLSGGDSGIDILNGSTGTFSFGAATTITSPGGTAFNLSGATASNANVTYSGNISKNNAGYAIDIDNHDAGTVTFQTGTLSSTGTSSGLRIRNSNGGTINFNNTTKTLSTGINQAVTLDLNTGATISFTNGGLSVTTTSGAGFSATGGGTVTVQGTGNSITSTTGTALNVQNTTIGAGGLIFRSISSNGGSASGIILNTTGAIGGLNIAGNGGAGTGGTIANKTGADGSTTSGVGIYLNSTAAVQINWMQLNDFQNFAIRGNNVGGFTMANTVISGTNGTAASLAFPENYGEGSVYFGNATTTGLTGAAAITNCNISGGRARNVSVVNSGGTLNRLTITGTTFGLNQNSVDANQSLAVEARTGTNPVMNVTVTGSTFTGSPGDLANFTGQTNTTMDVVFQNNTLSNNHAQNLIGGGGMTLATQGVMTINVATNTMRDADGSAITLQKALAGTSLSGTIDNNAIGVSGVAGSGSETANGIFFSFAGVGTIDLAVTNNIIRNYNGNAGIYADNTGGTYDARLTFTGNTTAEPGPGAFTGFALTAGAPGSVPEDDIDVCVKLGGIGAEQNNFSSGDPSGAFDIWLGVSTGLSSMRLVGYSGSSLLNVENYVLSQNNFGGTTVTAYADAPATAANFMNAGAACGAFPY